MILLSCPPVYTLPGTWQKFDPDMTFGSGGKDLKDEIKEHARMHELGIAHGHEGGHPVMTQKAQEQDYPQHHHTK